MNSISELSFLKNQVYALDQTPSTNDFLKRLVSEKNLISPISAYARFQTSGRGQRDKVWESEKDENVLISFYLPISLKPEELPKLQFAIPILVREVISGHLHEKANGIALKWPNDLYIHSKKVAGILIENQLYSYSIIGIGINTLQQRFSANAENAVSLRIAYPEVDWSIYSLVKELICRFEELYLNFDKLNTVETCSMFNSHLYRRNEWILSKEGERHKVIEVCMDGSLKLEDEYGKEVNTIQSDGWNWSL